MDIGKFRAAVQKEELSLPVVDHLRRFYIPDSAYSVRSSANVEDGKYVHVEKPSWQPPSQLIKHHHSI